MQCFLQQRKLLSKGIDLRVLRTVGLTRLLHQGLLERGQILRQLLARITRRIADLAAQLMRQLVSTGTDLHQQRLLPCNLFLLLCALPGGIGAATEQHQQHCRVGNGQRQCAPHDKFKHA
ncbi:hypothetical protein GALL_523540 [mine drainage metagenome]|uniref:Uncharacterized protein n=1 Tax=mine drainage metagenome TaxID=410659 RepID=A0A1J5P5S5_9ZZZZ